MNEEEEELKNGTNPDGLRKPKIIKRNGEKEEFDEENDQDSTPSLKKKMTKAAKSAEEKPLNSKQSIRNASTRVAPLNKAKEKKAKENLRTTLMLTVVCILFLVTEFPQAVLLFFSIVMGNTFYENVYMPLGDFMDIIALINNAINFLLYCTMSRQFRETFYNLLISLWCCKSVVPVAKSKNRPLAANQSINKTPSVRYGNQIEMQRIS